VFEKEKVENIEEIKQNPLQYTKTNNKYFSKNHVKETMVTKLSIVGRGNLVGEDDVICGGAFSSTLSCIS